MLPLNKNSYHDNRCAGAIFFEKNKCYPQVFFRWMSAEDIKMESKNEFKKMNFKNRTCYYFDDIIKVQAINVDNILLDENNLVYNILYKESIDSNSFCIWFDKIDGVIKICNEVRYLEFSIILINSYNIN